MQKVTLSTASPVAAPIRRVPVLGVVRDALTGLIEPIAAWLLQSNMVSAILAIVMLFAFVNMAWFRPAQRVGFSGLQLVAQPAAIALPDGATITPVMQIAAGVMGLSAAAALITALLTFALTGVKRTAPILFATSGLIGMLGGLAYLSQLAPPPILNRSIDVGFWITLVSAFGLLAQTCLRRDLPSERFRFVVLGATVILNVAVYAVTLIAQIIRSRLNESVAFEITALIGIALYGAIFGGALTAHVLHRKGYSRGLGWLLGLVIGAVGNLFLLAAVWIYMPYRPGVEHKRIKLDEIIWGMAFLSPWLIGFILLNVHPMIDSYRVSLYNWRGVGEPSQYVGLRHIQTVISDPYFWQSFRNTALYTLILVPSQLTLCLLLALVLNRPRMRLAVVYRTIYFLPVVTSVSVVAVVMRLIFGNFGSALSAALGIDPPINPIASPQLALPSVILFGMWHSFGVNLVYFLAALQTVPQELYDAAKVDGANSLQEVWFITLPGIRPISTVIVFMAVIGSMGVFEQSFVLTRGGPFYASQVVSGYIYNYAFRSPGSQTVPNLGYASAAALFFSMIMLVLTATSYFVINRVRKVQA